MRLFILFELFLVLFTFYVIYKFEGEIKIVVLLMCLATAFIFEKLRKKRRFIRYNTRLKAQYFLKGKESDRKECTVIAVARKGMCVVFHAQEKTDVGSYVYLTIIVPQESEPIMVKGELRWIKQRKNDSISGIELTEVLDKVTFDKLRSVKNIKREKQQPQSGGTTATVSPNAS
jgi:hypothetical protein